MKKLLLGLTLLALFLTNTLHAQCKFDIVQEKFEGYVTLKIKHHDTLKVSQLGWSNGATESLIKVKENGSYCVKVQFKNGCIADGCTRVTSFSTDSCKATISYSLTAGKVQLCAKAENVKGYLWSSGEKTQCITPSKPGEYCVKVVFQNGCETKACYNHIIPNIDTCAVKIIKTNLENGALSLCILPVGIIKSLEWSNGSKELCIKPEKAGEFCVNVTYTNGCKAKECVKIESVNECKIEIFRRVDSLNKKTYFCVSSKSKIKNTYWSTGDSSSCIVPTKSGEYCVKVITAEGCVTSACIKYQAPSDNDCSVTIIRKVDQVANKTYLCAVTRSAVKSFVWSTRDSSDCIIPQKSGEYCVRIITSDGCETKACVNFVSTPPVDTCVVKIINTSTGSGDHTLCILPVGEVKYFEWSNGSKERCFKPEKAGEYCVKVQYANGCIAKECVKIDKVNTCKIEITRKIDSIAKKTYLCVVSISKLKTVSWSTGDSSFCIIPTKTDEYCVKVLTAEGCETKACIKYILPTGTDSCKVQITKAANTTQPGKYKLCILTAAPIKSVEWSNSSNERCIKTDKPGEYCVKVTFANGCVAKECIKIENENNECKLEIVKRQDNTLAYLCAVSNKKIKTTTWSTGDTTTCIKVEKAGEYCVKIITSDGCETRTCIKYTPSTSVDPSICKIAISRVKRDNRLYLCAETNNPALDNNIVWSNGTKGKCIEIKEKGRYCAEISINGCEAKACVTIDSISTSSILSNDTSQKNDEAIKITPEIEGILKVMKFGPNPVNEQMFVDIYASIEHTAKLLLFDMSGNLITNHSIQLLQGENTVEVNTETLQKGIYYVKVVNADSSETVKMVKAF